MTQKSLKAKNFQVNFLTSNLQNSALKSNLKIVSVQFPTVPPYPNYVQILYLNKFYVQDLYIIVEMFIMYIILYIN